MVYACPVNSIETLSSLHYSGYAKIFSTISEGIIEECCTAFGINSKVSLINKRKHGFLASSSASLVEVLGVFRSEAASEIQVYTC
jgi:hypothetical protein